MKGRVEQKLIDMGFPHTRTFKLYGAIRACWEAVCPLDLRSLEKARKTEVGNSLLIIAEFFGRWDGPGTREDFGAREVVPADGVSDRKPYEVGDRVYLPDLDWTGTITHVGLDTEDDVLIKLDTPMTAEMVSKFTAEPAGFLRNSDQIEPANGRKRPIRCPSW